MKPITTADIVLVAKDDESLVDSRHLALQLGTQHESTFKLLKDHVDDFTAFGKVRFQIGASPTSKTGQSERYALLTEDQCYLLLTYSRNTERARQLKIRLVKAFGEARRAAQVRGAEYLPAHHRLHDMISVLARGTENERFVHSNFNRLLNKVAGVESGKRSSASVAQQSMLVVAQLMAAQAIQNASNHRDGYQLAKAAVKPLQSLLEASPETITQVHVHGGGL